MFDNVGRATATAVMDAARRFPLGMMVGVILFVQLLCFQGISLATFVGTTVIGVYVYYFPFGLPPNAPPTEPPPTEPTLGVPASKFLPMHPLRSTRFRLQEAKDPHNVLCSSMQMYNSEGAGEDSWWRIIDYNDTKRAFRLQETKDPHNVLCSSMQMYMREGAGADSWWRISDATSTLQ